MRICSAILDDEQGGWCTAFVAGFQVAMQMTPAHAAHGADGFMADDAKWDELWNAVRDVCREDGTKDNEHEGRGGGMEGLRRQSTIHSSQTTGIKW